MSEIVYGPAVVALVICNSACLLTRTSPAADTGVAPVVRVKSLEAPSPISGVSLLAGAEPVLQDAASCQVPELLAESGSCAVLVSAVSVPSVMMLKPLVP